MCIRIKFCQREISTKLIQFTALQNDDIGHKFWVRYCKYLLLAFGKKKNIFAGDGSLVLAGRQF